MEIEIIGTGEAFDHGNGNNSCLVKPGAKSLILVDCGYQIPERLWARDDYQYIDSIYLSHTHADHAFGIVPLVTRFHLEGRKNKLTVIGHSGLESYYRKALDLGYPGLRNKLCFPVEFITLSPKRSIEWHGLSVNVAQTHHSLKNYAVRFESTESKASFCFSGDGAASWASQNLYSNSNLLIHEAASWDTMVDGHSTAREIIGIASELDIDTLVLTHFSHEFREDLKQKLKTIPQVGKMRVLAAEPGLQFQL